MGKPLDPRAGERKFPSPNPPEGTVPFTGERIGRDLLGPENPKFPAQMRNIEDNAEKLLRVGNNYQVNDMDTDWNPFTLPLKDLTYDARREFRARIDALTGLAKLIMTQGQGPRMFRPEAGRMLFGKEAEFDPRRLTMEQQTVRFTDGEYGSSGTHLRQDVIEHLRNQIENGIPTHVEETDAEGNVTKRAVKTAIIDVESPGLKKEENIWQWSLRMMQGGEQVGEHVTRQVSNSKMNWAGEYGPNRSNFDDFLRDQGKPIDDYEDSMREFLGLIKNADYIAGHNLPFDFSALQHGLRHTPAYSNDPQFKQDTDNFISKFYDTKTGKINDKWIDTAQHARHNLPDLEVAEELQGIGTTHSLTNILLQTDLMGRIKEELGDKGEDKINEQLRLQEAGGLHDAGVDTFFESYLDKYQREGREEGGRGLKTFPSGEHDVMSEEQRAAIVKSLPVTPNLPFTSEGMQNPMVQEKARAAGLIEGDEEYMVSPLDNMIIVSRYFEEGNKPNIAPDTPVSWLRNMYSRIQVGEESSNEVSALADSAGTWNDIFKDNIIQTGTKEGMIKQSFSGNSPEEWRAIQEELKSANIPFHGLDQVGRHLTAAQGIVNAGTDTEGAVRKAFGGDVAPVLKIFGTNEIKVVGHSQIAAVPLGILKEWEQFRIDEGEDDISTSFTRTGEHPQFVGTSFFKYNEQNKDEAAYTVQIPEAEKTSLLEFLKRHPSIQDDEDLAIKLEESFAHNTGTYGVQIGTLTGFHAPEEAARFRGVVEQIQGAGRDFSDQTPHFYSSIIGDKDGSVYLTGAFRQTEILNDTEKKSIAQTGAQVFENFEKLKGSANTNAVRETIQRSLSRGGVSAIGRGGVDAAYSMVRKNSPLIGIGASLAGLGYYKHRKKKKEKEYAETMAFQPTSPNPRNQQYGLVQRLDNNKIGHTTMGPAKHDQLFNGAY